MRAPVGRCQQSKSVSRPRRAPTRYLHLIRALPPRNEARPVPINWPRDGKFTPNVTPSSSYIFAVRIQGMGVYIGFLPQAIA